MNNKVKNVLTQIENLIIIIGKTKSIFIDTTLGIVNISVLLEALNHIKNKLEEGKIINHENMRMIDNQNNQVNNFNIQYPLLPIEKSDNDIVKYLLGFGSYDNEIYRLIKRYPIEIAINEQNIILKRSNKNLFIEESLLDISALSKLNYNELNKTPIEIMFNAIKYYNQIDNVDILPVFLGPNNYTFYNDIITLGILPPPPSLNLRKTQLISESNINNIWTNLTILRRNIELNRIEISVDNKNLTVLDIHINPFVYLLSVLENNDVQNVLVINTGDSNNTDQFQLTSLFSGIDLLKINPHNSFNITELTIISSVRVGNINTFDEIVRFYINVLQQKNNFLNILDNLAIENINNLNKIAIVLNPPLIIAFFSALLKLRLLNSGLYNTALSNLNKFQWYSFDTTLNPINGLVGKINKVKNQDQWDVINFLSDVDFTIITNEPSFDPRVYPIFNKIPSLINTNTDEHKYQTYYHQLFQAIQKSHTRKYYEDRINKFNDKNQPFKPFPLSYNSSRITTKIALETQRTDIKNIPYHGSLIIDNGRWYNYLHDIYFDRDKSTISLGYRQYTASIKKLRKMNDDTFIDSTIKYIYQFADINNTFNTSSIAKPNTHVLKIIDPNNHQTLV
jgi:hypothetical protein